MGKFMALWEIDQSKIPIDPKERGEGWIMLMAMVLQDFEKGVKRLGCLFRRVQWILCLGRI